MGCNLASFSCSLWGAEILGNFLGHPESFLVTFGRQFIRIINDFISRADSRYHSKADTWYTRTDHDNGGCLCCLFTSPLSAHFNHSTVPLFSWTDIVHVSHWTVESYSIPSRRRALTEPRRLGVWLGSGALLQQHCVLNLMSVKCVHIYIPSRLSSQQGPRTTHLCALAWLRVSHQQQDAGLVPLVIYIDSVSFLFEGMKTW